MFESDLRGSVGCSRVACSRYAWSELLISEGRQQVFLEGAMLRLIGVSMESGSSAPARFCLCSLQIKRTLSSVLSAPNSSSHNDRLGLPALSKPFHLYWELWTPQNLPRSMNIVLEFQGSWVNVFG